MKRLLLLIIGFLLLSSLAFAIVFPDVDTSHENYKAIDYLQERGIISGYEDGAFGPENYVTRAEAAKIIMKAFDINYQSDYEILFPDVMKEDWFFLYVMGGWDAGFINGYEDGTFRPGDTVNLAESLKILLLAAGIDVPDGISDDVFADVLRDEWYAGHALYAREHNILMADDYGKVYPGQEMTRAKFAEIIYRTLIAKESSNGEFPLYTNWKLYEGKNLPFAIKYDDTDFMLVENKNEVIFYKPDGLLGQFSPRRIYPNTAVVTVTVDSNAEDLTMTDYFLNIKNVFPGAKYTEFTLNGFSAVEILMSSSGIVDWYIYLDSGDVLVVYTEYGNGVLSFQLPKFIKAMLSTLEYREVSMIDYSEILANIFGNILVEGRGTLMFSLLPDEIIIETDSIGVGTGPIDYYYSAEVNYTFKYERASDVILDKREGETSAF